jgi:hypothetical protein
MSGYARKSFHAADDAQENAAVTIGGSERRHAWSGFWSLRARNELDREEEVQQEAINV